MKGDKVVYDELTPEANGIIDGLPGLTVTQAAEIADLRLRVASLTAERDFAWTNLRRLADFIIVQPGVLGTSEGGVDAAIRLITALRKVVDADIVLADMQEQVRRGHGSDVRWSAVGDHREALAAYRAEYRR